MTDDRVWQERLLAQVAAACDGFTEDGVDQALAKRVADRISGAGRRLSVEEIHTILEEEIAPVIALLDAKHAQLLRDGLAELEGESP